MNSGSDLRKPSDSWKVAPFWRTARIREYPTLTADAECDVAIIGGGIVGVSAALNIGASNKNSRVMLFEGGKVAEGSSGFSAGVISLATTVDLRIIEKQFGRDKAALLYKRLSDALEHTLAQVGSDMDGHLQNGASIYAASKESHLPILSTERETRTHYGMQTKFQDKSQLPSWLNGFHGALLLEGERGVNPVRLVEAIAKRANDEGCEIFENTEISSYEHKDGWFVLKAGTHTVKTRHLLIATGVHGKKWPQLASVNRLLVPVRGDIIVTEPSPEVARIVKEDGSIAMWDTYQMLYVYTRYLPDGRILSGGADSPGIGRPVAKTGADESIKRLHAVVASRHHFQIPKVEYAWQASFSLPADGLPILKQLVQGENRLIVASTDGLPSGMLLGEVIADQLAGKEDELLSVLSQDRKPSMEARLLALLPNIPTLRNAALRLAFFWFWLKDILS